MTRPERHLEDARGTPGVEHSGAAPANAEVAVLARVSGRCKRVILTALTSSLVEDRVFCIARARQRCSRRRQLTRKRHAHTEAPVGALKCRSRRFESYIACVGLGAWAYQEGSALVPRPTVASHSRTAAAISAFNAAGANDASTPASAIAA